MATFDAGSIESTLTLDRSPFAQGLRLARSEADEFERDPINVSLDLESGTALARLREQIARLDGSRININVNADGMVELEHLREVIDTLDRGAVTIHVDTAEAMFKIARLHESIDTLDKRVDIDVSTIGALEHLIAFRAEADAILAGLGGGIGGGGGNGIGNGSSGGGGGWFGGMDMSAPGLMLTAIATLAPIAVAAVVPLTAVIGGLASAFTSAGTGVGVLALGIIPVVTGFMNLEKELTAAETALNKTVPGTKQYADALAKVNFLQDQLNTQYGPMVVGLEGLRGAWEKWKDATKDDAMGLIVQGMQVAQGLLPRLLPIFDAFVPVISSMLTHLRYFIAGPEMERFLTFIQINGPVALRGLVSILGNLGGTFVNLMEAFAPFAQVLLAGLDEMTARWDHWAAHVSDTKGFHDFVEYATTQGPIMLQTLKDVAGALISIGEGIAPLSGPNMTALRILAETISRLPPDVITALAIGFEAWAVGMWAYTAATTAAAIATALLDAAASPIVLMMAATVGVVLLAVAAVVALGIGIYELATKTQFFQTVWGAVWGAAQAVWDFFVTSFHSGTSGIGAAWDWLSGAMSATWGALSAVWTAVVGGVMAGVDALVGAWNAIAGATSAVWDAVVGAVSAAGDAISGAVSTLVDFVRGVWDGFWGGEFGQLIIAVIDLVRAVIDLQFAAMMFVVQWFMEGVKIAWDAIVGAFQAAGTFIAGVMSAIGSAITTAWNAVVAFLSPIMATISSVVTTAWNAIKSAVSTAVGAVVSAVSTAWSAVSGATATAWGAVSSATSSVWDAVSGVVSTVVGAVRSVVSGAWGTISSLTTTTWNSVRDAITGPLNTAKTAVSNAITAIKDFFADSGTWLINAGEQIVSGLITGITNKIHDLTDAIGHLTSLITDHLPGSPVKTGPLRVLNDGYAGGQITQMIADGVNAKARLVKNAIADMADLAGMEIGGTGYINSRLGVTPTNTGSADTGSGGTAALAALLEEMQAMREATEQMTDEFKRQNDNMLVLARQGATL